MSFISSLSAVAKSSLTRDEGRSPRRRRAPLNLETLEGRDLMTSIPGVELHYGMISIQATQYSDNTTKLTMDASTNTVLVTHNNRTTTFSASEVYSVNYVGGWGGRDTFENDTNLSSSMTGMGGNNHFEGGTTFNTVYMVGADNTYDSQGGPTYLFTYNGRNNEIYGSNNYVFAYNY